MSFCFSPNPKYQMMKSQLRSIMYEHFKMPFLALLTFKWEKIWFFRKLDDDTCGILKDRIDPSDKTLSQTHASL
jgi:hypothetical protein